MTGKTKKKKRRMESDGTVGEKTANTHRERLTLMCRGEDQRRTACRMICVGRHCHTAGFHARFQTAAHC